MRGWGFFLIYFGYSLCGSDTWAKVEPVLTSNSFTHSLSLSYVLLSPSWQVHTWFPMYSLNVNVNRAAALVGLNFEGKPSFG